MPSRRPPRRSGGARRAIIRMLRKLIRRIARLAGGPRRRRRLKALRETWTPFRAAVADVYEVALPPLLRGTALAPDELEALSPRLARALESSEEVRRAAARALAGARNEQYDEAIGLLLAAATVDAMLAADIAYLDADLVDSRDPEAEPPEDADAERTRTLREADRLFERPLRPVAGGAAASRATRLTKVVHDDIDELVGLANDPAGAIVRGLVALALGGLSELIHPADMVGGLTHLIPEGARGWGARFLREHARKLLELTPADKIAEQIGDELAEQTQGIDFVPVLAWISAAGEAKTCTAERIAGTAKVSKRAEGQVGGTTKQLIAAYRTQSRWLERSGRWLRRAGVPLSHLVAPPTGALVVGAVFAAGGLYVAYSLTDRLDARDLGPADRVRGVVRIVEAEL